MCVSLSGQPQDAAIQRAIPSLLTIRSQRGVRSFNRGGETVNISMRHRGGAAVVALDATPIAP